MRLHSPTNRLPTASLLALFLSCSMGVLRAQSLPAGPIPVPAVATEQGSLALAYVQPVGPSLRGGNKGRLGVFPDAAASAPELAATGARRSTSVDPRIQGAPAPRRSHGAVLPWVGTVEWSVPEDYGADVFEGGRTTFLPWAHFEEELEHARLESDPPPFAGLARLPLFPVFAPKESDFSRKLKKLARAKLYREVRHRLRREWKTLFLDHPSLTYAEYESRLFQINNIGKDLRDRDDFSALAAATEFKQDFFGERRVDGESDIPLLAWGPFTIKDTGALKFDLGRAAAADAEAESLEVGDEKHVPLMATKDYEVQTAFNIDIDPFQSALTGDARQALRRAGISVEVSWLSDVLGRELVSTEMDLETDLYGDFKGFFNIVIKSR